MRSRYTGDVPRQGKPRLRKPRPQSVRHTVTIPVPLAAQVRRVAKERKLTISGALVSLAERGIRAELDAKKNLASSYDRFLSEKEPGKKNEAGKSLIRAIFGNDAIAKDPVL